MIKQFRLLVKKETLERSFSDINRIIRDVAAIMRAEAGRKRVDLTLLLAEDLPGVFGDRVQLQQVVMNLLINGLEAISLNGGSLRELIVLTEEGNENNIIVSVRDNGIGIKEGIESRIFDAFFTTKQSGLGMGLSICRSIIASHEGRMWVGRNPSGGTTFSFTLPSHGEE